MSIIFYSHEKKITKSVSESSNIHYIMYFLAILGGLVATGTADSDAVRFDGSPQAKLVDFLHHHETAYVPLPTNVPR